MDIGLGTNQRRCRSWTKGEYLAGRVLDNDMFHVPVAKLEFGKAGESPHTHTLLTSYSPSALNTGT